MPHLLMLAIACLYSLNVALFLRNNKSTHWNINTATTLYFVLSLCVMGLQYGFFLLFTPPYWAIVLTIVSLLWAEKAQKAKSK